MPPQNQQTPAQPAKKSSKPQPKANQSSSQNTLQIAEIRDGIVIMHDGSSRTVLMAQSINFDLMSPQERDSVEYAYQSFLNSLYFDIQVYVHSSIIDMGPYIEKLAKIRTEHDNLLLAVMMGDYIDFISTITDQTNVMDKKFYVIVPYYNSLESMAVKKSSKSIFTTIFGQKDSQITINEKTLEEAKTELTKRASTVMDGLQECGVQSIPLNTEELIELYYDSYNPDTATRQRLKNFSEVSAPFVQKGKGEAVQQHLEQELQK